MKQAQNTYVCNRNEFLPGIILRNVSILWTFTMIKYRKMCTQ